MVRSSRAPVLLVALLSACGSAAVTSGPSLAEHEARHTNTQIAASAPSAPAPAPPAALPADLPHVERARVPLDGLPSRGASRPTVVIVEYGDYQCPFCGRVQETLQRLELAFRDDVRVYYGQHPLPFHQNALPASQAALEAYAQGGEDAFWRMHDMLYLNQRALERPDLERYAQDVGLDLVRFRRALDASVHVPTVTAQTQTAERLGSDGTPGFFVNGRILMGAQPYERFESVVREEIATAQALMAHGFTRDGLYAALMRDAVDREPREPDSPEPGPPSAPPPPRPPEPDPGVAYRIEIGDSPARGPRDALVTIVEFGDYQCPFTGRVQQTLHDLATLHPRDLRIVFKHNPLPFHDHAMEAAEAAEEARAQRGSTGFWTMHDLMFANQRALERADLEHYASQVGLDLARFRRALDSHTHAARIQRDMDLAARFGARGTPTFFVNGRFLVGAQPIDAFQRLYGETESAARQRVSHGTRRARLYDALMRDARTELTP